MELIPLWEEQGPASRQLPFLLTALILFLAFQCPLPSFHLLSNPFNRRHTFHLPTPRIAFPQRYQHVSPILSQLKATQLVLIWLEEKVWSMLVQRPFTGHINQRGYRFLFD